MFTLHKGVLNRKTKPLLSFGVVALGLTQAPMANAVPIDKLTVPDGYRVSVAAEVNNPRQLAVASPYHLFVGSRHAGVVTALLDTNQDGTFDRRFTLARNLTMPSGIALWQNDLYIAATGTIYRVKNATQAHQQNTPPVLEVVYRDLPNARHHGWKYTGIQQQADGSLSFVTNVGAPCNLCFSSDERFASLMRFSLNPDSGELSQPKVIAHGVRNSVGFDWHPTTGNLWFTDNGRDMMGDDIPDDELNELKKDGQHFGYPFVHGKGVNEPSADIQGYRSQVSQTFTPPSHGFGAHRAPLGMHFYQGDRFPDAAQHPLFVALHGSWNRSSKVGYKVVKLVPNGSENGQVRWQQSDFVTGWLEGENAWGRPADISHDGQGGLLIADDYGGVIYRVSYEGKK
ncbi:MAG: PQQ-dependent sugar dehydrogenase [Pontibacterium sp.]